MYLDSILGPLILSTPIYESVGASVKGLQGWQRSLIWGSLVG